MVTSLFPYFYALLLLFVVHVYALKQYWFIVHIYSCFHTLIKLELKSTKLLLLIGRLNKLLCFHTNFKLSIDIRAGILVLVSLPKCDPKPLLYFSMDSALYASMDIVYCNMSCENIFMSVYPHDCDDMLHESISVVDIPNIKLLKKKTKKFHKNLSKFRCENDDLIAKLNKSNKLIEKYKKLTENSLEKMKEFECLNMNLDAKPVLSNKLVDDLKCENESLKVHAKCLIAEPIAKNEENPCCNHVVA